MGTPPSYVIRHTPIEASFTGSELKKSIDV